MTDKNKLSSSLEDYIKTIYLIIKDKQAARAKDIATKLKVNNSSVTGALKVLATRGYINYTPYDLITLTEDGKIYASEIIRKHNTLQTFFIKILCVSPAIAEEAACKMEHNIPSEVLENLVQFVDFIQICPRGGDKLIKGFIRHCEASLITGDCNTCIDICLEELKNKKDIISKKTGAPVLLKDMDKKSFGKLFEIKKSSSASVQFKEINATPGAIVEIIEKTDNEIKIRSKGYILNIRGDEAKNIKIIPYS